MSLFPSRVLVGAGETLRAYPDLKAHKSVVAPGVKPQPGDDLRSNNLITESDPALSRAVADVRVVGASDGGAWKDVVLDEIRFAYDATDHAYRVTVKATNATDAPLAMKCLFALPRGEGGAVVMSSSCVMHMDGVESVKQVLPKAKAEALAKAACDSVQHSVTIAREGKDFHSLDLDGAAPAHTSVTFEMGFGFKACPAWMTQVAEYASKIRDVEVLLPSVRVGSCAEDHCPPMTVSILNVPEDVVIVLPDSDVVHSESKRDAVVWMDPDHTAIVFPHGVCFDGSVKIRLEEKVDQDMLVLELNETESCTSEIVSVVDGPCDTKFAIVDVHLPKVVQAPPLSKIVLDLYCDHSGSMGSDDPSQPRMKMKKMVGGLLHKLSTVVPHMKSVVQVVEVRVTWFHHEQGFVGSVQLGDGNADVESLCDRIMQGTQSGGTCFGPWLQSLKQELDSDRNTIRIAHVITDGGCWHATSTEATVRSLKKTYDNLFFMTLGFGSWLNQTLVENVADPGFCTLLPSIDECAIEDVAKLIVSMMFRASRTLDVQASGTLVSAQSLTGTRPTVRSEVSSDMLSLVHIVRARPDETLRLAIQVGRNEPVTIFVNSEVGCQTEVIADNAGASPYKSSLQMIDPLYASRETTYVSTDNDRGSLGVFVAISAQLPSSWTTTVVMFKMPVEMPPVFPQEFVQETHRLMSRSCLLPFIQVPKKPKVKKPVYRSLGAGSSEGEEDPDAGVGGTVTADTWALHRTWDERLFGQVGVKAICDAIIDKFSDPISLPKDVKNEVDALFETAKAQKKSVCDSPGKERRCRDEEKVAATLFLDRLLFLYDPETWGSNTLDVVSKAKYVIAVSS